MRKVKKTFDQHKLHLDKARKTAESLIASRIKEARADQSYGWSQTELAYLLGVSQSTIHRVEHSGVIDSSLLSGLALVCNRKLDFFFGEPGPAFAMRTWIYLDRERSWWKYLMAHDGNAGTMAQIRDFTEPNKTAEQLLKEEIRNSRNKLRALQRRKDIQLKK